MQSFAQKSSSPGASPVCCFRFFLFPNKPVLLDNQPNYYDTLIIATATTTTTKRSLVCERTCKHCHQDMSRTKLAPEVNRSVPRSDIPSHPSIHVPSHTPAARRRLLACYHATQLHFTGFCVDARLHRFSFCCPHASSPSFHSLHCPFCITR